ncbi:MAG: glycine cleavage system protein GcvH [Candidatus Anammoxibacter sp.]
MKVPEDIKYSKDHEWVKLDDDVATIGLTDFAQHQLTDVVFVELPEIGKCVSQAGSLCVVESVKSVSDVFSPVSGEVVEVNNELTDKPELINEDPYGKGWIAKIKCSAVNENDKLMSADEYVEFTEKVS